MLELLATITPIGLVDSLSMIPFALVVLAALLGGPRPYVSSLSFLLGTALSYFGAGVLIALGLGGLIERATAALVHWFWHPSAIDYALSVVIGVALIALGTRWAVARRERAERREVSSGMSPAQAFGLGAGATLAGLWGALPYFAAIDQLLKADLSAWEAVLSLAYYNAVFVSLPALLVTIRASVGARADGLFDAVSRAFSVWGKRLLVAGMILLGLVMLADGIGGSLGHPLIPVA